LHVLRSRWAPPSDGNNTAAYVAHVCEESGVGPDEPLKYLTDDGLTWLRIVIAMSEVECGDVDVDSNEFLLGYVLAMKDEVR